MGGPVGPLGVVKEGVVLSRKSRCRLKRVADYAELARLAQVSRARITQIMNLLHLAPHIQEEILFLPRTSGRRASLSENMLRPITHVLDWRKQRKMWDKVRKKAGVRE